MTERLRMPWNRRSRLAVLVAALAIVAGCTLANERPPAPDEEAGPTPAGEAAPEPTTGEPMRLDVLVYNVEYGGNRTTDAVLADLDADIVGVLESYERLPVMARRAGYPYQNASLQLLSKYPIHEPSGAEGRYALIEVQPGHVLAFFNVHLDYVRYGPRLLRRGRPVEEVIASENAIRTSALDVPLRQMAGLIDDGFPVFFTGDHNQPSSLDYTEEAVSALPHVDEPVPWPVSEALLGLGFRDSYRDVHPDPVEDPGITHPGTGDRIDYVYAAGPSETLDSRLVGEEEGQGVDVAFDPWTSDHRAVLSSFEVTPVPMPVTVSVDAALVTQGESLTVSYRAPSAEGRVEVVRTEDGASELTEDLTAVSGRLEVDTSPLSPGPYEALLRGADGSETARVGFWIRDPDAIIEVTTDGRRFEVGQPITVSWTDGPANRWDWIGVYVAGRADPAVHDYLLWSYTGRHASGTVPPTVNGSLALDETAQGGPWPLPPGRYVVHYLLMDDYVSAGRADFEVVE